MKRLLVILCILPAFVFAQKEAKPKINKALNLWKEGKLDEAKEIIDQATTYEKTKDDGKTWYYRGLIYASIDTSSNEAYKSLATDALKTAMESFAKADALGKAGTDYFLPPDATTIMPIMKSQQLETLANYYLNAGINAIQLDEPDYEGSVANIEKSISVFEKGMSTYANDTLAYYVMGLAAQNVEQYDKAIASLRKYLEKGGTSRDVYVALYQIYSDSMQDKEKALELIREAKGKFPGDTDFPRLEISLLIDLDRVKEAKEGLEAAVAKNPDDKILHFYLAYTNNQLENRDEAIKHYKECLRIDPSYYEAQYYLSQIYVSDVDKLTKQINNLGISKEDDKKKRELYPERVKKCEIAIPYLEKLETMKAPDTDTRITVLEQLQLMYYYTAEQAKENQVKQKLKALGQLQ